MNKKELKKYTATLNKEELEKELMVLYEKFDQVKNYYAAELSNDTQEVLGLYKLRIDKEFQRASSRSLNSYRTTEINYIIKEFEKISVFSQDIADLKLYRIEKAVDFINTYHLDDQSYFASVAGHYTKVLKLIAANNLQEHFRERIYEVERQSMKRDVFGDGEEEYNN